MALRLSSPAQAIEPEAPLTEADHAAGQVRQLLAAGQRAIEEASREGFARAFTETATIADPDRRYQARKLLMEQALVVLASTASDARLLPILLAAAGSALDALDEAPAEPVLLNYAGVFLYELWGLDAARQLFSAAARLDPELPHVRRNLAGVKARRRQGRPNRPLHPDVPRLSRRATSLAARARPAEGMRISLCMIVRDEEEMLPRTLAAAAPAVDEIVIVDTGSQDRTIEIARSFGARVIERAWTGSFSDARNASFDAATGDWLLFLDADEVLVDGDAPALRALAGRTWREAFFLQETNYTGSEDVGVAVVHSALRLLRNRPHYRFRGRLHEQIGQNLPAYLPERIEQSSVRIDHYGYLGAVRDAKAKSQRNIELLLAQQAEAPPTPFFHFNLGSEYAAIDDPTRALAEYEKAWKLVEEEPERTFEFLPSLTAREVKALHACGRHERAIERALAGLERFPGFTDLVYAHALAAMSLGQEEEAISALQRCISMGDAPARYTAMVGCGTFLPRIILAQYHLDRGENEAAISLLGWCLEHHPQFFGTVHPYATALLRAGRDPAAVAATIEQSARLSPIVRFMLGTALYENGAAAEAQRQFEAVLERQPHSGAARVALTESLLYQRRNAEAAAAAAAIDSDSPLAATALRSELFARLLDGDAESAERRLDQAAEVGLGAADTALYRGWLEYRQGDDTAELPPAAAPLLELMLEALLRVRDFENFEALLGLFHRLPLPRRQRQEALAQMYLRRGFLRSAAREWMAVCEAGADPRSLVGLAQVARANGQSDTASQFVQEALRLDPRHAPALRLAAALS